MQLKILHVSDFHFKEKTAWESRPILKKLIKAIQSSPHKPDLIAVTGDIAYHGLASEYALAKPFFENLLEACQLSTNELFMVPGNHDVNRKAVTENFMVSSAQTNLLTQKSQDGISQIFGNDQLRGMMLARHAAYADFVHELTGRAEGSYWVRSLTKDGLQIGIAGFNSAWMCWQKEEAGKLLLGQYQLNQLTKDLDNYPLRLALLHHPKDFLASWDRPVWDQMAATFHMILRGHLHETEIVQANNQRHAWLEVAAGSAYSQQIWSNAFHWIHLDVQSGETIIEPWVWFKNVWQRERNLFSGPDQCGVFQLNKFGEIGAKKKKYKVNVLLVKSLRNNLKSWYERWDIVNLGVVIGRDDFVRQISLSYIYQPLRMSSEVEIESSDFSYVPRQVNAAGKVWTVADVLQADKHLFVVGKVGSGKTTWLRYLFNDMIVRSNVLPFYIEARKLNPELVTNEEVDVFEVIARDIRQKSCLKVSRLELENLVQNPGELSVFILVDGWDELGDCASQLRCYLKSISITFPSLKFVITSRPFGDLMGEKDGFIIRNVQTVNDNERLQFVERFADLTYGKETKLVSAFKERVFFAWDNDEYGSEISRNLLFLTMMLFFCRTRSLPDRRAEFLSLCVENLLSNLPERYREKGVKRPSYHFYPSDVQERFRVLSNLSFDLMSILSVAGEENCSFVFEIDYVLRFLPAQWTVYNKRSFLRWLEDEVGLIIHTSDGCIRFVYWRLCEILSANHLSVVAEGDSERASFFQKYAEAPLWWEVLRYWMSIENNKDPARIDFLANEWSLETGWRPWKDSKKTGNDVLFWLSGSLYADGLGSENGFDAWVAKAIIRISEYWCKPMIRVAKDWSYSKQSRRKEKFLKIISFFNSSDSLGSWIRLDHWASLAGLSVTLASDQSLSLNSYFGKYSAGNSLKKVAASRVMAGSHPLWCGNVLDYFLLRLWPSKRFSVACRIQSAISCGFKLKQIPMVESLSPSYYYRESRAVEVRDEKTAVNEYLNRFVQDLEDKYGVERANRIIYPYFSQYGLSPSVPTFDWCLLEMNSCWRINAYSYFVQAYKEGMGSLFELFFLAIKSFNGQDLQDDFRRALLSMEKGVDPMWLCLARHIAGLSTDEDRTFLCEVARDPSHGNPNRDERLQWGLQMFVRGDILLEDNQTIMTLDEYCSEYNSPVLPYLEAMTKAMDIDWDI